MVVETGLLLGLCGVGVVCFSIIAAMLFVVLRLTGRGYMEFLSVFAPGKDDKESPGYIPRSRPNLRHIAQSQDFDTAIAKNIVNDDQRRPDPFAPKPEGLPPANPRLPNIPRTPPNRINDNYSDDEVFGGLLDDDGDGRVDY